MSNPTTPEPDPEQRPGHEQGAGEDWGSSTPWQKPGPAEQPDQPQATPPPYGTPPTYGGQPPYGGQPGYGASPYGYPPAQGAGIQNYLVPAIIATVFCCLPAGVVSIVYAAQVSGKLAAGDVEGARQASANARTWLIVSVALGVAVVVLAFLAVLSDAYTPY